MKYPFIKKIDDFRFLLPRSFQPGMNVDGLIFTDETMLHQIIKDNAHKQVANVACLPGIVRNSLAMPDIHWGYGFPIGGVAAFDKYKGGVISPGGVGYDINCGVRILKANLTKDEIKPKLEKIIREFSQQIPVGVGSEGQVSVKEKELNKILEEGAGWAVRKGYGRKDDLEHIESSGCIRSADSEKVSGRAKERGFTQPGTLGAGNHFVEIGYVEKIYDQQAANSMGLSEDQITIMIHSGSRGLGHQVCTDYVSIMQKASQKYGISIPDRQLSCAPIESDEGQDYLAAMSAAANYAWCNRQILMHFVRSAFCESIGKSEDILGLDLIYDVAHNIAKMEKHMVGGKEKTLCVHRKGATRAFPGQPVLIPGDMGRYSYIMLGTEKVMEESFGSVCHGAGRVMSRHAAMKRISAGELIEQMNKKGIILWGKSKKGLPEEAPEAYKDVREVVGVVEGAGLARKVVKLKPLGVIKG